MKFCLFEMRAAIVIFLLAGNFFANGQTAKLSHGPLLGGVTESFAGVWLRTDKPAQVEVQLIDASVRTNISKGQTTRAGGLSHIASFEQLKPDSHYNYRVFIDGQLQFQTNFSTPGPQLAKKTVRIVYGSCYATKHAFTGETNEFAQMAARDADAVIILGDFPYTKDGRLDEVRAGHQGIRATPGFRDLTASRPVYAIWDDHDFGPNDSDGTHPHVGEAFKAFKEHWPNPSFGLPNLPGIFSKSRFGDIDFFRLDCRYHSRRDSKANATMLGEEQFAWLCQQLKNSTARYKLIFSGPQLWRRKGDSWGGEFHAAERDRLLKFIEKEKISGALFISGDVHRSNIHRTLLKDGRCIYDFTSSPLAQNTRVSPKEVDWPSEMIFSHPENNQFCELEFRPSDDKKTAVIFRVFSVKSGLVLKYTVAPQELGL